MKPRSSFRGTAAACVALGALLALPAEADVEVEILNGDSVTGTIRPGGEDETFSARISAQSPLSVTVKGLKVKGKPPLAAPAVTFRVLDDGGTDIAAGRIVQAATSAKVAGLAVPASGRYRVVVSATSGTTGNYSLSVKWASVKKLAFEADLTPGPAELIFPADAGATATISVKASGGSAAKPRLDHLTAPGLDVTLTPAVPASSSSDKQTNLPLGGGGDIRLRVVDIEGLGGLFACTIALKNAKPRALDVSAARIDASFAVTGSAFGEFVGVAGGVVDVPDTVSLPISGASVTIPAGALAAGTTILVGSAPAILPLDGVTRSAGPAVFFGPEGTTFAQAVTVKIPFEAATAGDPSKLSVLTRDAKGKVTRVDPGAAGFTLGANPATISFPASHFSSYLVIRQIAAPDDLNGDGFGDVIVTAPDSNETRGNVFVFFGTGDDLGDRETNSADATFLVGVPGARLGTAAVTGDFDGDGQLDLAASAPLDGNGRVLVFRGGPAFVSGPPLFTYLGGSGTGRFGSSLAVADVNGDKRDDLLVGADASLGSAGAAFLFLSPAVPASRTSAQSDGFVTGAAGDKVGSAVEIADVAATAGLELIVGAEGASGSGAVYVFGQAGFAGAASAAPIVLTGESAGSRFGARITSGEVNGDRNADLVVSAPGFGGPGADAGAVYVFTGSVESKAAASATRTFTGLAGDQLGASLAVADVYGERDGVGDIAAGAPFSDELKTDGGAVYVLPGGVNTSGVARELAPSVIAGQDTGSLFGATLRTPDLSGNGRLGLAIGEPLDDSLATDAGIIHLYPALVPGKRNNDKNRSGVILGSTGQKIGSP